MKVLNVRGVSAEALIRKKNYNFNSGWVGINVDGKVVIKVYLKMTRSCRRGFGAGMAQPGGS